MLKDLINTFLFAVAGCLLLAPVIAADETNRNLVSVAWVGTNLQNPDLRILDASPAQIHASEHIPGAVSVDIFTYGLEEKPASEMEELYQSWGISSAKKTVIYDQGAGMMATKLFFLLCYHGFPTENLSIMDGGLSKWQAAGLPVTNNVTPGPLRGSFRITKTNEDVRVRLPEFVTASGDPVNNALLEALGPDWHFGKVLAFEKAGHVPYGILLPSSDFYNSDQTFKSAEELRKMMRYLGVRPEQQIHTYCGGGVAASVPFFALKFILGYPKVKLYTESEMGWLADERQLPYWTYDAPFLMREAGWLKFWGGQIIRTYASPDISIVDVRPVDEFNQGHVPFALNVPADVFKRHVANPEKLAKILGPAGVDASHEAVVVSGPGLTKDAALAFVVLEKLGQKRVSLCMEPIDRWTQRGFPVMKGATVVGPKKTPRDLSIPPTEYPGNFRKDVVITDSKSSEGLYPKVFIASGKSLPARAQDGKVVHVPYTELLNADGTPKAAKDIWEILAKAGVPRYAELVCFSDDPGEAAANYFILRLMGFPDIKVLLI